MKEKKNKIIEALVVIIVLLATSFFSSNPIFDFLVATLVVICGTAVISLPWILSCASTLYHPLERCSERTLKMANIGFWIAGVFSLLIGFSGLGNAFFSSSFSKENFFFIFSLLCVGVFFNIIFFEPQIKKIKEFQEQT